MSSPPLSPTAAPAPRSAAPTSPRRDEESLIAALDAPISRPKLAWRYRMALAGVAGVMVLLPLLYVAFIAAVAGAVEWHATSNTGILTSGSSGGSLRFLLYVTPIAAGVIGIVFLLKPLIAPRRRGPESFALSRDDQPFLFSFVDHLCATVGAPAPKRIQVDTRPNASASLRRGFLSFVGQDLVLTIGLPLASHLSVRQLSGILAHEFGHFSQGGGMRLGYTVHRVQAWFARVVYERDAWDERLERWARQSSGAWQVSLIVAGARAFVWLSRRVLWALMQVGLACGAALSRQMEFDADLYESRLAGCDAFEKSMVDLTRLSVADDWARDALVGSSRTGTLADDLPALTVAHLAMIDRRPEVAEDIAHNAVRGTQRWFHTHPCASERIAHVRRDGATGTFTIEAPATVLFDDFDELCRNATRHHYSVEHELDLTSLTLIPTAEFFGDRTAEADRYQVVRAHFGGYFPAPHGIFSIEGESAEAVQAAREKLHAMRDVAFEHLPRLEEALEHDLQVSTHVALLESLEVKENKQKEPREQQRIVRRSIDEATAALEEWAEIVAASLHRVEGDVDEGVTARAARDALAALGENQSAMHALRRTARTVYAHLDLELDSAKEQKRAAQGAKRWAAKLYAELATLRGRFAQVPHPFPATAAATPNVSLADDLFPPSETLPPWSTVTGNALGEEAARRAEEFDDAMMVELASLAETGCRRAMELSNELLAPFAG